MRCFLMPMAFAALAMTLTAGAIAADPPATKKAKKPLPVKYQPLAIGEEAPDFRLPGVDGRTYSLKDFADARVLAVVFTCNHCPTAQAYEGRIIKMRADYKDRGVALVAISPNDPLAVRLDEMSYTDLGDSLEDMKVRAREAGFTFPYLYDGETQETSKAYGVIATPQIYIFDKARKLQYNGRIDDSDVKAVTSHDARNALDAMLAGKPVPVETTRVFGCSTKWADSREDTRRARERADAEPVALKPIDDAGVAKLAGNDSEKLRLINVWANSRGSSIAELPEFATMNQMYRKRGFELVTICLDEPDKEQAALEVLKENHLAATNYVLRARDRNTSVGVLDKEWNGSVPFTIMIAPGGKVLYRKAGSIDSHAVKRAVVGYLGRTYGVTRPTQGATE
jgi:thiol-disulfide isomerase/thioredoxin